MSFLPFLPLLSVVCRTSSSIASGQTGHRRELVRPAAFRRGRDHARQASAPSPPSDRLLLATLFSCPSYAWLCFALMSVRPEPVIPATTAATDADSKPLISLAAHFSGLSPSRLALSLQVASDAALRPLLAGQLLFALSGALASADNIIFPIPETLLALLLGVLDLAPSLVSFLPLRRPALCRRSSVRRSSVVTPTPSARTRRRTLRRIADCSTSSASSTATSR